jgi:hypothetical protein
VSFGGRQSGAVGWGVWVWVDELDAVFERAVDGALARDQFEPFALLAAELGRQLEPDLAGRLSEIS